MITQPWALSTTEVIDKLETKPTGLTDKKAANRLLQYGNNTFHNKEKISVTALFLKQFLSPLIFLLLGAGVLTFILAELAETFVIALAVLLNVLLGFYHEYHAENTLVKLTTYIKDRARVIRNAIEHNQIIIRRQSTRRCPDSHGE